MHETYEAFLVEVPALLEELRREVEVAYDDASLDRIEAFYLDVAAGRVRVRDAARLKRAIAAYFGEAVIRRVGGRWAINPLKRDTSFGMPVIVDWAPSATRFSPVERRDLLEQHREPFLRDFIAYAANKQQFEADFFKEFG